jgi:signal transduction histidine kinase
MPNPEESKKKPLYIPLRWKVTLPVFGLVLVMAMAGAYVVANQLSSGLDVSQTNILLESSRAISERAAALYERQRADAQAIAFTVGVPQAIAAGDTQTLQNIVAGPAQVANLDSVIVTNPGGMEVLGLLWVETPENSNYSLSQGTDLSAEPVIRAVIDAGYVGATGLVRTPQGVMLYTAVPINGELGLAGIVMVGQTLSNVLVELEGSAMADVAFYADGALLQTTYPASDSVLSSLAISPELYTQAVAAGGQIPVQTLTIAESPYEAAYFPLNYGPNTLGVAAALLPDNIPYATEMGRQLISLLLAGVAAGVVIVVFMAVARMTGRVEKVTEVAQALAEGKREARTQMQATDEVGAMGQALDQFATVVQQEHDLLQDTLRRQRRETAHLTAVLESLPDGIVVQDMEGRVMLMNEPARKLLGSQRMFRASRLDELGAMVAEKLGAVLAPGLYMLGDPQQLELDGKMLKAQAAAVMNLSEKRVGTVIVLRDVTEDVRRELAREKVLDRMMQEIQQPLAETGQMAALPSRKNTPISEFAREISRNAVALQKLVVEMRELAHSNPQELKRRQRPLHLETLVWKLANEWRQVAQAANLKLHVMIEHKGQFILGDERRLRWAIGNILDNAIKYTPAGGSLSLEIRPEAGGMAQIRVRDNGTGISDEDKPSLFTRFFRGTPTTKDGHVFRVPGTGQGLAVAKDIIEAHGGRIEVKSKVGVGTAVYMALPLTSAISIELPQLAMDLDGETVQLGVSEA